VFNTLISRRMFATATAAVRSFVSLRVETPTAPEPAGLYGPDELPSVEDIEAAAAAFDQAAQQARAGDRGKRAAKKVLDRLPAGRYGSWLVSRVTSNRQTADLDAIRAIFAANNLGPVPMKSSAASIKVERLITAVETAPVLVPVAA
jgi:hypothetical protein